MDELKLNIFDSSDIINEKLDKIQSYLEIEQENLYGQEVQALTNIVRRIQFLLPREEFSGKHGVLIYAFEHKDSDREVYISPQIYLTNGITIVYEVFNPKKYHEVSPNPIYKSYNGKYFCEIPLKDTFKYLTLENIFDYITKFINSDFEDLQALRKRQKFATEIIANKKIQE